MKCTIFYQLFLLIFTSVNGQDILRSDHESFEPLTIPSEVLEKLIFDPEVFEWLSSDSSSSDSSGSGSGSGVMPMGLARKRKLLQNVSSRVADIGLVYIVRDSLSTYIADDERSRFYEGTLLAAGIGAYGLTTFASAIEHDSPDTSSFIQDASDVIGIGAGIASFSLDLQSLVEGSKCIVGFSDKEDCVDDRQDLILDTVGSFVSVLADTIGFVIPSVGPYTAVMEILWILLSEAYKSPIETTTKMKVKKTTTTKTPFSTK